MPSSVSDTSKSKTSTGTKILNSRDIFYFIKKNLLSFYQTAIAKYLLSALVVCVAGIVLYYLHLQIGYQAVSLIFLLLIALLPLLNFSPGPIFFAAVLSACIWNFFFIPPSYTFRIGKVEDALMFVTYFIIASVLGLLISRIRTQQIIINLREKRTATLYNLTGELSSSKSLDDVVKCAIHNLEEIFSVKVVFFFTDEDNLLQKIPHSFSTTVVDESEWNIANLVHHNYSIAGRFTNTMPITPFTYLPLMVKKESFGVIGLKFPADAIFNSDTENLLRTFVSQISIAVQREQLKELAKKNLVVSESEKLYKTLFDSLSHELKTPITTIIGAASSLKEERIIKNPDLLSNLAEETNIAAERLNRLVENLLDITRIESGNLRLQKNWGSIIDLINSAIAKIKLEGRHHITFEASDDLDIFEFDFPLLEQAILNILQNCVEYTPDGSVVSVFAKKFGNDILITISDNGNGIPENEINNIFKKFYRASGTKSGGIGLGLSIAKGFIEAHKGSISVKNKYSGGAEFSILMPIK